MDLAVLIGGWLSSISEKGFGWTVAVLLGALLYLRDSQGKAELKACQELRFEQGERVVKALEGSNTTAAALVATTESRSKAIEETALALAALETQIENVGDRCTDKLDYLLRGAAK